MRFPFGLFILICLCSRNTVFGSNSNPIIAIDLGNTYSSVGVFQNGKVAIIPDKQGNKLIPSYVAFEANGGILVGEFAKSQLPRNSNNTVYAFKTLLGRCYDDKIVQCYNENLSLKIVDDDNMPKIEFKFGEEIKHFSIVNITSLFVAELKQIAESYLGQSVKNVVMSIPTYFGPNQRTAIKEAAQLVGLNVIRWIREPEAAAMAYQIDKKEDNRNVLVYHLGGETFDVTLLSLENGVFEVTANKHDIHLGGEKFNKRVANMLIDHCEHEFGQKLTVDTETRKALDHEIEKAKISLSTYEQSMIDFNFGRFQCSFTVTRDQFEAINMDLFEATLESVEQVISDSFINKTDIHDIILIGGSTRIPKIRILLNDYFDEKLAVSGLKPDFVIVHGAVAKTQSIHIPEQKTMMESFLQSIIDIFFGGAQRKDELK